MKVFALKWFIVGFVAIFLLTGCAHDPVALSGNGACHPSQDLPEKQTMNLLPEKETSPDDLWAMFLNDRSLRSGEQGQYNSLHRQCVSGSGAQSK